MMNIERKKKKKHVYLNLGRKEGGCARARGHGPTIL